MANFRPFYLAEGARNLGMGQELINVLSLDSTGSLVKAMQDRGWSTILDPYGMDEGPISFTIVLLDG